MKPAGLALVWIGYTLAYFGFCSMRGPGVGLLDLVVPGRTFVIPTGGSGSFGSGDSSANPIAGPGSVYDPSTGLFGNSSRGALRTTPAPAAGGGQVSIDPTTNPVGAGGGVA